MATDQRTEIEWRGGAVPVSSRYDDPYFSIQDGLAETRHVFLDGNDLPARFRPGFHIVELGFGTGLNMLAALQAWRGSGAAGPLRYTGFEAFPLPPDAIDRALTAFPDIRGLAGPLLAALRAGSLRIATPDLQAEILVGDARDILPGWSGMADAWFLDGFAPAKNPGLWEPALLAQVALHTRPKGSFATYTAAGHVRRALAGAGFAVERRTGFGRKRHMTVGRMRG